MERRNDIDGSGSWTRTLMVALLIGVAGVPALAAGKSSRAPGKWIRDPNTADLVDSRVASEWFDLLYRVVMTERISPPVASRAFGYAGVALYEAVVPGMPDHLSLAGQLNDLDPLPAVESHRKYHWPTVANAALADAARGLFPTASEGSFQAIHDLETAHAREFKRSVPPPVYARSAAQGRAIAAAVVAWAGTDGYAALNNCAYAVPVGSGLWRPTPPAFVPNPLQPCWGQLRPFVLADGAECAPPPPPPYATDPGSDLYQSAKEVYDVGKNLTDEQRTIALFWADNPGATGTPPGHWIAIVGQLARNDGLSLGEAAEGYARVGLSVADAFIACWNAKYAYNVLRPVSYVQDHIDASWLPLLPTPPFPEYTSGHSTQSGASAWVLTDFFGVRSFTDTTTVDFGLVPPLAPRTFDSFEEAGREAMVSRLYGGIHYRAGNENGFAQGQCIGQVIGSRVRFLR